MSRTSLLLISILLPLSLLIAPSHSCGITVYWGQNGNEGDLKTACATNNYKYVTVAFLNTFGSGQPPALNLAGHCIPSPCSIYAEQIRYCQSKGIQVLLSLGGAWGSYNISSVQDAEQVAAYLWRNYLSGEEGPLGDAALDGIDFDIEFPISREHWDDLAKAIAAYSTPERKIYLSAAPQCPRPDANLDAAINTGLFDYVWVQFYNNPQCDYSGGLHALLNSWNAWSAGLPAASKLFLGLPALPQAASSGYIPSTDLIRDVLPEISKSRNYGGVMLWSRYYDVLNNYSPQIISAVCPISSAADKFKDFIISQVV